MKLLRRSGRKLLGKNLDEVWLALDGLYSLEDGVDMTEDEQDALRYAIDVLNRVAVRMGAGDGGIKFDR